MRTSYLFAVPAAMIIGFAASDALAQCPAPGSCFVAHSNPGCDISGCCQAVCNDDPFCCENQWDNICANSATLLCGCGAPLSGSCFVEHLNSGCNDDACCEAVCADDPYCCENQWDVFCVAGANNLCGCGAPQSGSCAVAHDQPWCDDELCCEAVCAVDPFCCATEWDGICANGALEICTECGVPAAGSCFETGLAGCDDETCCFTVCGVDPFCCDTQWDSICVNRAFDLCVGCGGVSTGNCFETGLAGCSNESCCQQVCAIDNFCCDVEWDGICVDEAISLCTACGEPSALSCFSSHSAPACNDLDCCSMVCAVDPFCCVTAWDGICVGEALDMCDSCPADIDNNGSVGSTDLAQLLGSWGFGSAGDVDGDGDTDTSDLAILLGAWGNCP